MNNADISSQIEVLIATEKESGFYQDGDEEIFKAILEASHPIGGVITGCIIGDELVFSYDIDEQDQSLIEEAFDALEMGRFHISFIKSFDDNGQENNTAQVNLIKNKMINEPKMAQAFKDAQEKAKQKVGNNEDYKKSNALAKENEELKKRIGDQDTEFAEMSQRFNQVILDQRLTMDKITNNKMTTVKYGAVAAVGIGVGIACTLIYQNFKKN